MRWIAAGLLIVCFWLYLLISIIAPSLLVGEPVTRYIWYPLYDVAMIVVTLYLMGGCLLALALAYRENQKSAHSSGALTD